MMVICSHDYTRLPNATVWRIACINGLTVQRLSHVTSDRDSDTNPPAPTRRIDEAADTSSPTLESQLSICVFRRIAFGLPMTVCSRHDQRVLSSSAHPQNLPHDSSPEYRSLIIYTPTGQLMANFVMANRQQLSGASDGWISTWQAVI